LSTEQTRADFFVEGNPDTYAFGRAQECILLRDQFAADLGELNGNDFTGIRSAEGGALFALAAIPKNGHEERLADEQTFSGAEQRAHEPAALLGAVTENGLHFNAIFHVHHAA